MKDLASLAKREGKSEISVPKTISGNYAVVNSLEQVLRVYMPLIVQIDGKKSRLTTDGLSINTWYQARVLENLSKRPLPAFVSPDFEPALSPELTAPNDFFLIHNSGGVITIDGMLVKTSETPVALEVGQQYLLFIRFDDNRNGDLTRTASLSLGRASVFNYTAKQSSSVP
ncbi:MAG: hypothetical protein M3Z09_01490 [Acidobacteriota bacterium]|nr:hypothetical protein [Acidobacteriota bacterium]